MSKQRSFFNQFKKIELYNCITCV